MDANDPERIIEAALFMSSKPLAAAELGKLIGVAAPGFVMGKLDSLKERYEKSESAIEIAMEDGKYHMRLRPQYVQFVKEFAKDSEISRHALRTLAYVSKNEGMKKSDLCKRLGSSIYSDVAELASKGFLTQKKSGRSTQLYTTPKFKEYFGQQ